MKIHSKSLVDILLRGMRLTACVVFSSCAVTSSLAATTKPNHEIFSQPSGPLLTDLSGWTAPEYYSTLQNADLDGDGQREMIARDKLGLHAWMLQKAAWIEVPYLPALSDATGWRDPSRYQTITFARLQLGSQQQDVVARDADGIHVWRLDKTTHQWAEIGAQATRILANGATSASATDWTQSQHYNDIFVGDLNHDGVDELIARGKNGLEVYAWNAANETWQPLAVGGPLTDAESDPLVHTSPQFVTLNNGDPYVVSRKSTGVEVLTWKGNSWQVVSSNGPFSDGASYSTMNLKSLRTFVDEQGQLLLFGLTPVGDRGTSSIAVYRWDEASQKWGQPNIIQLPGTGWQRPSQFLSLRAGDFYGDGGTEIVARGSDGLHVFQQSTASGTGLADGPWTQKQVLTDLRDAAGYSLASSYYTLQTLPLTRPDAGVDRPATALLGRSPRGVEVYHAVNGQLTQATPFPQWANANQGKAYQLISQLLIPGTDDIRSEYQSYDDNYTYWTGKADLVHLTILTPPSGSGVPQSDSDAVRHQLDPEMRYVAAAHAWFQNNQYVSDNVFAASGDQLPHVLSQMSQDPNSSASVTLFWTSFISNIVGQISRAVGQPEVSLVSGLIQDGIQVAASQESGNTNQNTEEASKIDQTIINLKVANDTETANKLMQYVSDWGLLQQIGVGSINNEYGWGQNTTVGEITAAKNAGIQGQELWIYETLSTTAWHSWWCNPNKFPWYPFGGCLPDEYTYPRRYQFLISDPQTYNISFVDYVTIHGGNNSGKVNFGALDELFNDYGVALNDILTACNGWHTDDPGPSDVVQPNNCGSQSSALLSDTLPSTLSSLEALRDKVKSYPRLPGDLQSAIRVIRQRSHWKASEASGAPSQADIDRAKAESPSRYIDKTEPIQFLDLFITRVQQKEKAGALPPDVADAYAAEAYNIIGIISDDGAALQLLGTPND